MVLGRAQSVGLSLLGHYQHSLSRRPLVTKSLTSLAGLAIGDIISQLATNRGKPYDYHRTLRLAAFGGLIGGPIDNGWFQLLDKTVMPYNPKHPLAVLTKLALDQVIMAPLGTFVFYVSVTTMAGTPEKIPSEIEQKLVPTVISSYKIWPAAHLINFAIIPSHLRILYINAVTVAWATILSTIAAERGNHL